MRRELSEPLLLGGSRMMQKVREQIRLLAPLPWHVRIEGPTGSGKNLAARLLHALSAVCAGPFVTCNLAMLPDGMEAAELVGHRRGAYTSAVENRAGLFEMAHRGTLFLDELATATPETQRALLQLVDEQRFRRIGDGRDIRVDVRIVFATNGNLEQCVACGSFRQDLFHRLGSLVIEMPALIEHREDIPELAESILHMKAGQLGRGMSGFSTKQMEQLMAFDWPGNVRQLEKTIEYFVVFGHLPDVVGKVRRPLDWRERIDAAMAQHDGNKSAAARSLGIPRSMLYAELKRREA